MKIFGYTFAQLKKSVISVLGFVVAIGTALTSGGLIPSGWLPVALAVVGFATTWGVFLAQNAPIGLAEPTVK
jgi:hypothetical protein